MAAADDVRRFRAILDGEEHELDWRPGATLLDCMLAEGLDPAFQCMDGRCGSCMVKLLDGEVEMRKNEVLSARDLARNYVLLCQSIPRSADVRVDCDA